MGIRDVQILREAVHDLEVGRAFYERQQAGVGGYFWDSLIADLESLVIHAGVHRMEHGYYRPLAKRFPMRSITRSWTAWRESSRSSRFAGTRPG